MSGSLGIHASNVKVVSVYEGSLIVNYDIVIEEEEEDTTSNDTSDSNSTQSGNGTSSGNSTGNETAAPKMSVKDLLAQINEKQQEVFATGQMDLGAPITDVEVAIIEAPEPETNSTDTNSTESDDSSSDSSSDSNSDSSSDDSSSGNDTSSDSNKKEKKKFKLISGGRITAPGYKPIIINKKSFYVPKLLQNKTEEYNENALNLAKLLTNVTQACMDRPCTLHQ